jgi:transposase
MNTEPPKIIRVERPDDIPVLMASLKRLKVAEFLDERFPKDHRWEGNLSLGEVVCGWLPFVTSQGDHRLYNVEPWAKENRHALQGCLGKTVRPLDFHDDRLALILDKLAQPDIWQDFETDLNRHTVRVYRLDTSLFRIDTTTASTYIENLAAQGLVQFGHSKDNDDLPQVKVAVAALDPLGMPVTTFVVPGNRADDPLYVPAVKKVQQAFGQGGKTFVCDCKAASLGTRAYLADSKEYYLCPLPKTQLSQDELRALLQPVWTGRQTLTPVYRPTEDEEQAPELVAEGFFIDVPMQAKGDGKQVLWTERHWVVRSLAFAQGQHKQLDRRLETAEQQLLELNERKQGKKRLTAEQMREAAASIVKKQRVQGLLTWQVRTTTHERPVRAYGGRPACVVQEERHTVAVSRQQGVIEKAKREMGWRVYATNHLEMDLAAVVWAYRGQNRLERVWSRLKGNPLSLTPMYLQEESRIQGLVLLLSLAVRLLTLLEGTVRQKLADADMGLTGLYAAQTERYAYRPSAELLLRAFKNISFTIVEVAGQQTAHVTALTPIQLQLLDLWELPDTLYKQLALYFAEPPPI